MSSAFFCHMVLLAGTVSGLLWLTAILDREARIFFTRKQKGFGLVLAVALSVTVSRLGHTTKSYLVCLECALLLFASMTDLARCEVYQFTWWLAWPIGGWLVCGQPGVSNETLSELAVFILLQECFFGKLYGRADCHAFVTCALLQTAFGRDFAGYTLHMAITFLLFAMVQIRTGNVATGGRLKVPKPLIPYITLVFFLFLVDFLSG